MTINQRISQLPSKELPQPSDIVLIVDTGVTPISTKKTTLANILASFRNVPSGFAVLDSGGKIPSSQLPPLAINDTFVVNSLSAMLALVAEVGDVAVRSDINKSFILTQIPASTESNWIELLASGISGNNTLNGGNY